jgi:hypothetical protein
VAPQDAAGAVVGGFGLLYVIGAAMGKFGT